MDLGSTNGKLPPMINAQQFNQPRIFFMRSKSVAAWAWLIAMVCVSSPILASLEPSGQSAVIGDQPGTQRTVLANGLEIVVISEPGILEANQPHQAQAWLVVRSGSLFETDNQRGAALVLEMLIRQGTLNHSPKQINEILIADLDWDLKSPGSFVGFDHAAYLASMDVQDQRAFEQAFGFFRSLLNGRSLVLTDERIAQAIDQVIVDLGDEQDAELRARRRWLPRLMAGMPFGDRMPAPEASTLATLSPKHVREFAKEYYRSAQATLIVVGDFKPAPMMDRLIEEMEGLQDHHPPAIADGRCKQDPSGRTVLGADPDIEETQAALIWFRDREDSVSSARFTETWNTRAGEYRHNQIRSTIRERVAGEVIRYRLGRQFHRLLGHDMDMSVDQVDLWGQVDLLQIVIARKDPNWEEALDAIIRECDRLFVFGVSDEEVKRARRALLSRWHRDAQEWDAFELTQRMGLYHWLITTGRPVIDITLWDQYATAMMSQITDREIEDSIQELIDPRLATYVAIIPQTPSQTPGHTKSKVGDAMIQQVVQGSLSTAASPIDPKWFESSQGSLLDKLPASSASANDANELIKAISQHPASGVWQATLSNGIKLWAMQNPQRAQSQDPMRIYCTATISGQVIDELVGDDVILQAAIAAWNVPATELRSRDSIEAYINEYGINIQATLGVGYSQLQIDAPLNASTQAIELMYTLLDRPMIEQDTFDDWQTKMAQEQTSPLEQGIRKLYRQGQSPMQASEVSLDDAQRVLARICRFGEIDIAIIGSNDGASLIEETSPYFGMLTRSSIQPTSSQIEQQKQSQGSPSITPECIARSIQLIAKQDQDSGVIVGFLADTQNDLEHTRALVLASMVFDQLLDEQAKALAFVGQVHSQVAFTDLLEGQSILFIRADCSNAQAQDAKQLIETTIESILVDGISEDQLNAVRNKVLVSVDLFFGYPRFWSHRLSVLTANDLEIDDIWGMRQGYESITLDQINDMLNKLFLGNDQFTIEVVEQE